jgi:stage V sporulation protein B
MPTVQIIDTAIVTNSLLGLGYSQAYADSLFGTLTSVVNPLINMPAILSLALAMSLVPAISASHVKNNLDDISTKSAWGLSWRFYRLPCAVGFLLLANPSFSCYILRLANKNCRRGTLLAIMAVGVLFLTVVQTTTGILQGFAKPISP